MQPRPASHPGLSHLMRNLFRSHGLWTAPSFAGVLILLISSLAPACEPVSRYSKPVAQRGRIDFSEYSLARQGSVPLNGEWLFLWQELPGPTEFQDILPLQYIQPSKDRPYLRNAKDRQDPQDIPGTQDIRDPQDRSDFQIPGHPPAFFSLPGRWNGHPLPDGQKTPATGYATFALRYTGLSPSVQNQAAKESGHGSLTSERKEENGKSPIAGKPGHGVQDPTYALRMKDALTAYRIYIVDDSLGVIEEPVMTNGVVGTSASTSVPQHLPVVRRLPPGLTDGWILFQVSNYHDGIGGPIYPLILGTEQELLQQREQKRATDFLVLGVFLVMSLYHLGLYIQRKEDKSSLWFALFNAILGLRMMLTEKHIQEFFPEPDVFVFEILMKMDHATAFLALPVFFTFLRNAFLGPTISRLEKPSWIVAVFFLLTLLWPQRIYGPISLYYFIWAIFVCVWMLAGVVMAARRREIGARMSFAGLFIVLIAAINDTLLANGFISSTYVLPYAFILFVIAQSYILIQRFSHAFNTAAHLSQYLQKEVDARTTELQVKNRTLEEISRQRTLFFQNISHELRTPLTLILGPLQSLLDGEYGKIQRAEPVLRMMTNNARRLLRLINQLLDLSRIEAGQVNLRLETIDVGRMLYDIAESFTEMARLKEQKLIVETERGLFCEADPEKMEKVFYNLISNAIKYTPHGGEVHIRSGRNQGEVMAEVSDTGPGIPEEAREKIFQRFYQLDGSRTREQEGTGIGLSIVKEFIDLHKGRLELHSSPGEGSRFVIFLPESDYADNANTGDSAAQLRRTDSQSESGKRASLGYGPSLYRGDQKPRIASSGKVDPGLRPPSSGEGPSAHSILVVDDSEDMQAFMVHILGGEHSISLASNGEEGLRKVLQEMPDLVISDVMMPIMDGPSMIERIKQEQSLKHIPCVLLSARMDEEMGPDPGLADGYLGKPFKPPELRQLVRAFLSGDQPGSVDNRDGSPSAKADSAVETSSDDIHG